ncbi:MAG: PorV/PorQ family protein, partial [Bacteroidota bacterium]
MKLQRILSLLGGVFLLLMPATAQQDKLAQTGMKFLSVSYDARAAGFGDAMTAIQQDASSLFYNPSAMGFQQTGFSSSFNQVQWIADIRYNAAAVSFQPTGGRLGVIGVSVIAADYGDLIGTVVANNEAGFEETGNFSPTAFSIGAGYAKSLSDRFSVGGHIKYVTQDLGTSVAARTESGAFETQDNEISVVAFDFGVMYKTGFRSLTFALAARNFAQEITFESESFQLPLNFRIGLAMDVLDFAELGSQHQLLASVEASNPRDFSEQVKVGAEYR